MKKLNLRFTSALTLAAGTLVLFGGCNGSSQQQNAQPGKTAQFSADTIKKCDDQRKSLRTTALGSLGITALQTASDKVMKEIVADDLEKIVDDGVKYKAASTDSTDRDDAFSEMSDLLGAATKAANLQVDSATPIQGTTPARVVDIGSPDYIDSSGNFSLGSAHLQNMNSLQAGDISLVVLTVGLNPDSTKSFQTYSIGLYLVADATTGNGSYARLSDYIEPMLPPFCKGTPSSLDGFAFNTIPVGASIQPEN